MSKETFVCGFSDLPFLLNNKHKPMIGGGRNWEELGPGAFIGSSMV
jgi:hypothetical protein